MEKDSYWFKHDSTAGRGLRMRKMAHIYGHWGKGIYWDVIEILRDQSDYRFSFDESSLQMLSDLIGCKDDNKFISWFNDCINIGLLTIENDVFYSEVLCRNMENWKTKKSNGSKGGRPKKTETITEIKPNQNLTNNRNETIREEKIRIDINIGFETFWDLYGKKVGDKLKCKKKWESLKDEERETAIKTIPDFIRQFSDKQYQPFPETYLNQKRWNDEIKQPTKPDHTKQAIYTSTDGLL